LKISIQNAGPVKKANIDLKNLVVFTGPNNAGKSFIATIMYASLSQTGVVSSARLARTVRRTRSSESEDIENEVRSFLESSIKVGTEVASYQSMPDRVKEYFEQVLKDSLFEYATNVAAEISRTTGVPLFAIRRVAKKRAVPARIQITSDNPSWNLTIRIMAESASVNIQQPDLANLWQRLSPTVLRRFMRRDNRPATLPMSLIVRETSSELVRICFKEVPLHTKYLPAARSGILQSHKALAGSLVRRSTLAGIEDLRIPAMSGVVTDFLSEVIELDPSASGDFKDDAKYLEDNILHGRIALPGEPTAYPEVVYDTTAGSYPLGRTSSMVSELAPVVLYLRHRLRNRDLLFIEEPEAHLHPATQVKFARVLVRLINRGLRIVLTTHSEFFLQQLNNAIVAGDLNQEEATRAGVASGVVLASSMVAAYYFAPTDSGTTVTELKVDIKEGILEYSFGAVSEQLYNEAVALDRSAGRDEEE
jgi:predicted ATPase